MDDTDYNSTNYMGPAQGDDYSMTPSWQDQFMGGLRDVGTGIKGMYDRFTAPGAPATPGRTSGNPMQAYKDYQAAQEKKLQSRPAMPTNFLHDQYQKQYSHEIAPAAKYAAGGLADLAAGQSPQPPQPMQQPGMLGMQGTPDGTLGVPISQDGYGLGRLNSMTMNQNNNPGVPPQGQNQLQNQGQPQHPNTNFAGFAKGGYLDGGGDGMSDSIPASIEGNQPAALADGEFVIPADVVSHIGNGSTKAGAKRLYHMLDQIRKARTGHTKQGKQIDANKFLPH